MCSHIKRQIEPLKSVFRRKTSKHCSGLSKTKISGDNEVHSHLDFRILSGDRTWKMDHLNMCYVLLKMTLFMARLVYPEGFQGQKTRKGERGSDSD